MDEDELELVGEGLGLVLVGEVAALASPVDRRLDDAADHLLHARLALGRAQAAAEVLLRDDVRGRLRPEPRELDVLLLEGRLVLAGDEGVADLPLDLVERVAPGDGEVPAHTETGRFVDNGVDELLGGRFRGLRFSCGRHLYPPKDVPYTVVQFDLRGPTRGGGRPTGLGTLGRASDGLNSTGLAPVPGPTVPGESRPRAGSAPAPCGPGDAGSRGRRRPLRGAASRAPRGRSAAGAPSRRCRA